jgi:hypothetical protein
MTQHAKAIVLAQTMDLKISEDPDVNGAIVGE